MQKYELSLIRIFPYVSRIISVFPRIFPNIRKYGYDSVHIGENANERKPVFRHISQSFLLNISSHNFDLYENKILVSARIYELFNCTKIGGEKIRGARNLMGLRYIGDTISSFL